MARPSLPSDPTPVPGGVVRDLKRTARGADVDDLARAVGGAGDALDEGDVERAVELLTWAAARAPRSTAVREGLGVAAYLAGDFETAQRELLAYRRMSGRADQNHLLADAARALGRTDRVPGLIEQMREAFEADQVPAERLVEAIIVQAAIRADDGDYEGALVTLDRAPLPEGMGEAHGRAWYAAGDIAERMGDLDRARQHFEAVLAVDEDFLDAAERLESLGG